MTTEKESFLKQVESVLLKLSNLEKITEGIRIRLRDGYNCLDEECDVLGAPDDPIYLKHDPVAFAALFLFTELTNGRIDHPLYDLWIQELELFDVGSLKNIQ